MCLCVCACVCVRERVSVSVYVYMCVCTYVRNRIHSQFCLYTQDIFECALSLVHIHKYALTLSFLILPGSHSLFLLFDFWACVPHTSNQVLFCFVVHPPHPPANIARSMHDCLYFNTLPPFSPNLSVSFAFSLYSLSSVLSECLFRRIQKHHL